MVELLEVLDKNGKPTGVTKTKGEILRDGNWRKVVHIWLVDDQGNLLIQQRASKGGILDNQWDVTVGGGVSSGETSLHAAKRELKEELGLDFPESKLQFLDTYKMPPKKVDENRVMKDFSDTFSVRVHKIDLNTLKLEPREVQSVDVISLKELSNKLKDPVFYANWVQHGQGYYQEVIGKILATLDLRFGVFV